MADLIEKLALFSKVQARQDISPATKVVFDALLLSHHNTGTGKCNPGFKCLTKSTGLSRDAITKAIKLLRSIGVIDYVSCGGGSQKNTNSYRFPDLDGSEIQTGQKNVPVRNQDSTGTNYGPDGSEIQTGRVRKTDPRGPYFGPKPRNNQELNQEKNTAPPAPHQIADVWVGFHDVLVLAFRTAGYAKTPIEQGRIEAWRYLGYEPAVCLAAVRDVIARNKEIRALSWFDRPMEQAHANVPRRLGPKQAVPVPSHRIYEGSDGETAWKRHEGQFNPVNRDAKSGRKYIVRSTPLPVADPSLKDASNVTAELELIADRRASR